MKQGSSGLTIRERQTTYKPAFELTPKKVNQWIAELPIANLGESSKSVYRLLVDLNQTVIDSEKRFAIISIIEPVVKELSTALEKQFIKNHITLSEKQKKIAALLQAIQTELTLAYHAIIDSILVEGIKRSQVKILAASLSMAMIYHGFIILRCYQLYTSIPSRIWREIYCVYKIAITNKLEAQVVSANNQPNITTHFLFIRILLLSIANPYQLRQQDIQMLWDILPELSEHATLMSHAYNKQHFIISLDSGLPPIHKSLYESDKNNNLKLTASSAIEHLKLMLASVSDSGQQNLRKSMLLRHLVQCWSHGTHRSFARTPCNVTLDISIGLGATHYLLTESASNKANDFDANNDDIHAVVSSLENATLADITEKTLNVNEYNTNNYLSSSDPVEDAWAKLYRPNQIMKSANSEAEAKNRTKETIAKESYRLEQVALLNMSPGGYCIQISADNLPKHAQTGEVIGFLEYDNKSREHWSVAVVRWVRRQTKDNVVQMGVQLLAPGAVPIKIQLRNTKLDNNDFQRALILPALTGVGQPATLLTNPLSFSINNKVRIIDHGNEYDARLVKEFASSSNFKQFQYEKIDGDNNGRRKKFPVVDSSFNRLELDDIWDLI